MDHLWRSAESLENTIRVPYVCSRAFQYDPDWDFSMYPEIKGIGAESLMTEKPAGEFEETVVSILQEWLFFGLMTELLLDNIDTNTFVKQNGEGPSITTEALPKIIRSWENIIQQLEDDLLSSYIQRSNLCLTVTCNVLRSLRNQPTTQASTWPAIFLSILILGQTLATSLRITFGTAPVAQYLLPLQWPSSSLLTDCLQSAGWCPNEVAMLEDWFSVNGVFFATSMEQHDRNLSHSRCNKDSCCAYQVDRRTYITKHLTSCQGCKHRAIESYKEQPATNILRNGSIPVIKANLDPLTGDVQMTVEPANADLRFIAISHVWADGLGNPRANSLPICQIRRLVEVIRQLPSVGLEEFAYFWIDTLCIPVIGEGRKLGIRALRDTYNLATITLVLDARLQKFELDPKLLKDPSDQSSKERQSSGKALDRSAIESVFRLVVSGWTRRLWTFQEGVLAKSLMVQYQNFAVAPELLEHHLLNLWSKAAFDDLPITLIARTAYLRQRNESFQGANGLAATARALQWRNTSNLADEAICIANILDLDVAKILETAADLRMPTLLSFFDTYPTDLLFAPGRHVSVPEYSWAPSSFLNTQSKGDHYRLNLMDNPYMERSPQGLTVHLPGFLSDSDNRGTRSSEQFVWIFEDESNDSHYMVNEKPFEIMNSGRWRALRLHEPIQFAILIQPMKYQTPIGGSFQRFSGLLTEIVSQEEAQVKARILTSVTLIQIQGAFFGHQTMQMGLEALRSKVKFTIDQKWCLCTS